MTFRNNFESNKSETKKYNLYYFTYIKYKNKQHPSILLEARIVLPLGAGRNWREHKDSIYGKFCFMI